MFVVSLTKEQYEYVRNLIDMDMEVIHTVHDDPFTDSDLEWAQKKAILAENTRNAFIFGKYVNTSGNVYIDTPTDEEK